MKNKKNKLLTKLAILLAFITSIQLIVPGIIAYIHLLEKCFNKNYNLLEIKNIIDCYRFNLHHNYFNFDFFSMEHIIY